MENEFTPKDSLAALQATIANYDSKAATLLTAVGVIFGFSLFSVGEIMGKTGPAKTAILIIGSIYIAVFLACITVLSLVVFPRRRNKKEDGDKVEYPLYSGDLFNHLKKGDLKTFLNQGVSEEAILDQIKVCARIARTKETLLRVFGVLVICFSALLGSLLLCLFL